jgi:hypothetical protein
MIGWKAVLAMLVGLVIPAAALVATWGVRRGRVGVKILFTALALFVFFAALTGLLGTERAVRGLRSLRPASVKSIEVGGVAVAGAESRESIVKALNRSTFFMSAHGGWSRKMPVQIKLMDGSVLSYLVANYPGPNGAVIFAPNHYLAYSQSLPEALRQAGAKGLGSER